MNLTRCRITISEVTHEQFIHHASWCPTIPLKMFLKTFSRCLDVGKLKNEQKLIVLPYLHSPPIFPTIFVLKEDGTQSHSAKFLNWGDHVNSVPDLAASRPRSKSWLPTFRHITKSTHDNCLVPWRIHRQNFLLKPNVDKNLWIRTISRSENWRDV